jgi:hypothetical protein
MFGNADDNSDSSCQLGESPKSDMCKEFAPIPGTSMNWTKKLNELLIDAAWPICSADEIYGEWGLNMTNLPGNSYDSEGLGSRI